MKNGLEQIFHKRGELVNNEGDQVSPQEIGYSSLIVIEDSGKVIEGKGLEEVQKKLNEHIENYGPKYEEVNAFSIKTHPKSLQRYIQYYRLHNN